jgi:glutamine amidotransferase-like uncharacterized protein
VFAACNGPSGASGFTSTTMDGVASVSVPDSGPVGPLSVPPGRPPRVFTTDVMLFEGAGTWGAETGSFENLFAQNGISYRAVSSAQLDAMSVDEIASFGLLLIPGGSGGTVSAGLSAATHARLREAVQRRGVSYLGFCAGSFVAVAPAPASGQDVSYGFGIVAGPELDYYYLENSLNPDIAMTLETFPDGQTRDLVWYGGPVTPNVAGGVVAKYPNGEPAISEMWSGNGFVVLSGVHPAAPQSVRDSYGLNDGDGLDTAYALELVRAAIHQQPLPAF